MLVKMKLSFNVTYYAPRKHYHIIHCAISVIDKERSLTVFSKTESESLNHPSYIGKTSHKVSVALSEANNKHV